MSPRRRAVLPPLVQSVEEALTPRSGLDSYFIKWKGYGEDEKTWEPIEASPPSPPHLRADGTVTEPRSRLQNLQNCLELVKEFERNQADIKRRIAEKQAATSGAKRDKSPAKKAPRRDCASDDSEVSVELSLKKFDERREKAKKAKANGESPVRFPPWTRENVDLTLTPLMQRSGRTRAAPRRTSPTSGKKRPRRRRASPSRLRRPARAGRRRALLPRSGQPTTRCALPSTAPTLVRYTDAGTSREQTPSATAKKAKKARKIADECVVASSFIRTDPRPDTTPHPARSRAPRSRSQLGAFPRLQPPRRPHRGSPFPR